MRHHTGGGDPPSGLIEDVVATVVTEFFTQGARRYDPAKGRLRTWPSAFADRRSAPGQPLTPAASTELGGFGSAASGFRRIPRAARPAGADAGSEFHAGAGRRLSGGRRIRSRDITKPVRSAQVVYRLAAEQGDADSAADVGEFYHEGWGVPVDFIEAARWLRIASARG